MRCIMRSIHLVTTRHPQLINRILGNSFLPPRSTSDRDSMTFSHSTISHCDNFSPDNFSPDNISPDNFSPDNISLDNFSPGHFLTRTISHTTYSHYHYSICDNFSPILRQFLTHFATISHQFCDNFSPNFSPNYLRNFEAEYGPKFTNILDRARPRSSLAYGVRSMAYKNMYFYGKQDVSHVSSR